MRQAHMFLFISLTWLESSDPYNNPTKRVRDLAMMAHTCNASTGGWRQEKRVGTQGLPELCSKTLSRQNNINTRFAGVYLQSQHSTQQQVNQEFMANLGYTGF